MSRDETISGGFWAAILFVTVGVLYVFVDRPVAYLLHENSGGWRTAAAWISTISRPLYWYIAAALLGAFALLRGGMKPGLRRRLIFISLSLLVIALTVLLVKIGFGRYRPPLFFDEGLYGFDFLTLKEAYFSFPSGHAACAAGVAALASRFSRWGRLVWLYMAIVAASRLVLEVHFLSDVIAGAVIGGTMPAAIRYLAPNISELDMDEEALHGV